MAATEYAPGTVAIATVRGVEGVRVMRARVGAAHMLWHSAQRVGGQEWHPEEGGHVTDIRPLLVLDLHEGEAKELADYLSGVDMHLSIGDRLQISRQIRKQTKPPRIPEPGWGGKVEARAGDDLHRYPWLRYTTNPNVGY